MPAKDVQKAKEIGRRIQQARQEAGGMTQRELGDLLGVTERSVAAYESGQVVPYRFLRELENILNVEAAWILHGEEAMRTQESRQMDEMLVMLKELRAAVADLQAERER
jgi:transcriptional regulator with XRE-family HTH domain